MTKTWIRTYSKLCIALALPLALASSACLEQAEDDVTAVQERELDDVDLLDEASEEGAGPTTTGPTEGEITPQSTDDCDSWVPDIYVAVKPFTYANRKVVIMTGRVQEHSYAAIQSGYRAGDRVWYDRRNEDDSGHRQCGPFSRSYSGQQRHYNLAPWGQRFKMRACIDPAGSVGYKCGAWHLGKDL